MEFASASNLFNLIISMVERIKILSCNQKYICRTVVDK